MPVPDASRKGGTSKDGRPSSKGSSLWRNLLPLILLGFSIYVAASRRKTQDLTDYGNVPPWPIFIASMTLSSLCRQFADWLTPPAIRVFETTFSVNKALSVYACSRANWPDALADGPKTCGDLAKTGSMSVPMARRLLRACVAAGMFYEVTGGRSDIEDADRIFENSPFGDVLRDGHPYSLKHFVGHHVEDTGPGILRILEGAQDESKVPFSLAHNLPHSAHAIWKYFASNPAQDVQFNKAMTALDGIATAALVNDYPWSSKCSTVVDVGGGRGSLLAAIMAQHQGVKGILFDQPIVVTQSRALWDAKYASLLARATIVGGSFFNTDEVPKSAGGYCYSTKVVLHDWNDDDAIKILTNVVGAMQPGDRFLVLEGVQMEPEYVATRAMLDIQMLTIGGRERTVADFKRLFERVGLQFVASYPTRSIFSVLEAVKAA
jgi:hypothetical protein